MVGGYPILGLDGGTWDYPPARSGWWGVPWVPPTMTGLGTPMTGWGTPLPWLDWYPPTMAGWGNTPIITGWSTPPTMSG